VLIISKPTGKSCKRLGLKAHCTKCPTKKCHSACPKGSRFLAKRGACVRSCAKQGLKPHCAVRKGKKCLSRGCHAPCLKKGQRFMVKLNRCK
jgi:hypothetical protein